MSATGRVDAILLPASRYTYKLQQLPMNVGRYSGEWEAVLFRDGEAVDLRYGETQEDALSLLNARYDVLLSRDES